ncbi:hypothetical protein [Myxococcus phage Mx1]|nr:hypothetical protein [Myxococcus phage Mx1]
MTNTRSVPLTQSHCVFIQGILKFALPAEIHLIVTAPLQSKVQTEKLVEVYQDFQAFSKLSEWAPGTATMIVVRTINERAWDKLQTIIETYADQVWPTHMIKSLTLEAVA